MKAKVIPINIDKNLERRLRRFAQRRNVSIQQLANELLKVALDNKDWVNLLHALREEMASHANRK